MYIKLSIYTWNTYEYKIFEYLNIDDFVHPPRSDVIEADTC